MAYMGHDENVFQTTSAAGTLNSSGWSVNFGSGSASSTGGPASGLGSLLASIDPLWIALAVGLWLWKGK